MWWDAIEFHLRTVPAAVIEYHNKEAQEIVIILYNHGFLGFFVVILTPPLAETCHILTHDWINLFHQCQYRKHKGYR